MFGEKENRTHYSLLMIVLWELGSKWKILWGNFHSLSLSLSLSLSWLRKGKKNKEREVVEGHLYAFCAPYDSLVYCFIILLFYLTF
jgi:hypothetical protein